MTGCYSQVGKGLYKIQFETDNEEHYERVQNEIRKCIDKKPASDGWIPCIERQPKMFDIVILAAKCMSEKCIGDMGYLTYEGSKIGENKYKLYGVYNSEAYKVAAWRPLPEQYKEDKH